MEVRGLWAELYQLSRRAPGGGFWTEVPAPARGLLLVIYASDLGAAQARIKAAGGKIVKDTFSFPGGHRFHFADPSGNELAVWSENA